jgi:predicted SPOUT superfamily RNA methylase MTH1
VGLRYPILGNIERIRRMSRQEKSQYQQQPKQIMMVEIVGKIEQFDIRKTQEKPKNGFSVMIAQDYGDRSKQKQAKNGVNRKGIGGGQPMERIKAKKKSRFEIIATYPAENEITQHRHEKHRAENEPKPN